MKKNLLLLLIALFCIIFVNAQNNEQNNPTLPSEDNIFDQADLVIQGTYRGTVAAFNPMGIYNFDDGYRIEVYKVSTVYKGAQTLTNGTVYIVKKGGWIGIENSVFSKYENFSNLEWRSYTPPQLYEKGIRDVTPLTPCIIFLKSSNNPDDKIENYSESTSNYAYEEKYTFIDEFYDGDGCIASVSGLAIPTPTGLHNWMKQFNGYNFADWKPAIQQTR